MEVPFPTTLAGIIRARLTATPDDVAWLVRAGGAWREITWGEVERRSARAAAGLSALGVTRGDRVGIAAPTSAEWLLAALGAWRLGAAVTTVYPSSTAEDMRHVLGDAGCVAAVVGDPAQLAKLRAVREGLPDLRAVVLLTGEDAEAVAWSTLGDGLDVPEPVPVHEDDPAILVYTSGTTGRPKGVVLTHLNVAAVCHGAARDIPMEKGDLQLLFLPLAHVYGLIVALVALHLGAPTALEPDHDQLPRDLPEVRPTFFTGVPRVFEKVLERIRARGEGGTPLRRHIVAWALEVARRAGEAEAGDGAWDRRLRLEHALAERLVFRKVRAGLGGRLRAVTSGGAPIPREVAATWIGLGIAVLEGYGMTESCAVTTANHLGAARLGTVGPAGEGVEVRIADDGEVLIRGPTVMAGYWNNPEATAEVLRDGWLHTGDVGALDAHGHLRITDRKKHLIVTANGKNVAPAKVENLLKATSPLVGDAVLVGDRRPCCVALVALDPDALGAFAARMGLQGTHAALARHPEVIRAVQADVDRANATLARFEQVKAIHVLDHLPSVEGGDLTPSLKVRRDVLLRRFATEIEALYAPPS